jgi:hypothetical protein
MKAMSKHQMTARHPGVVVCPDCQELLRWKGRSLGFRCRNGHTFPIEMLVVLKEQRLDTLGWPLNALERLETDLLGIGKESRDPEPSLLAAGCGRERRSPAPRRRHGRPRTADMTDPAVPSLQLMPPR